MPSAKVTSKGQITIPLEVRERLGLDTGDRVDFIIRDSGEIVVEPATVDLLELRGSVKRRGRRVVSLEEMQRAIEAGAVRK
ncbi:MAG: AbrB/MazE/SpoVT family DNA-binding domain-containing protein [Thermoanaerobaculia bacterium]|jgi:AbrB family looped-hinge helix DNA binding protein